ncbi:hypothetical protein [Isoptericola croceus]|uniref:hypothetical protein n=1 Tax=Isoptericola croceus TaxID=3031406 RepID=UPI0023F921B1|nr:hypothetical protein [Isoptericola croceus]
MSTFAPASVTQARSALAAARRHRAEYLMSITEGLLEVGDLIKAASAPDGHPLLVLRLHQVLLAQPGWGTTTTDRTLARLAGALGAELPPRGRLTVAWLLDPRSDGSRYLAWCEALRTDRTQPPWPGFPHTPGPRSTWAATLRAFDEEATR